MAIEVFEVLRTGNNNRAVTWQLGEMAELHLNVSAEKIRQAHS